MMGKIKISNEQEVALKGWSKYLDLNTFVESKSRELFVSSYRLLEEFTIDEFARLLYEPNSYEVEVEYKVGDYVVNHAGSIGVIDELGETNYFGKWVMDDGKECLMMTGMVGGTIERHATPEEIKAEQSRRMWKKINRQPGEIKDGDIGIGRSGYKSGEKSRTEALYRNGDLVGLYPIESLVSLIVGDSDD